MWSRIGWGVWAAWVAALVLAVLSMSSYVLDLTPLRAYAIVALSLIVLLRALRSAPQLLVAGTSRLAALVSLISGVVAVITVVVIFGAFQWRFIGDATRQPPGAITDVTAPGQFAAVLAYAKGLSYDSVTHNVADSTIIVDSGGAFLTKAWIAPAVGANFVSQRDLFGLGAGHGRVVARIRVDTSYGNRGYPKLNLPSGVSYVWVDSLVQYDTTGAFRAFIVPDRPGGSVVRFPASRYSHYYRSRHSLANFPIARWVLQKSNCVNLPCGHNGCCQSCP